VERFWCKVQERFSRIADWHTEAFMFSAFWWGFLMDDDSKDDQSERRYPKLSEEQWNNVLDDLKEHQSLEERRKRLLDHLDEVKESIKQLPPVD
jgi:hypothetical protein